jgi:hypothetical protein
MVLPLEIATPCWTQSNVAGPTAGRTTGPYDRSAPPLPYLAHSSYGIWSSGERVELGSRNDAATHLLPPEEGDTRVRRWRIRSTMCPFANRHPLHPLRSCLDLPIRCAASNVFQPRTLRFRWTDLQVAASSGQRSAVSSTSPPPHSPPPPSVDSAGTYGHGHPLPLHPWNPPGFVNQLDPILLDARKMSPPPSTILRIACRPPLFTVSGVAIRRPPCCRPRVAAVLPLCAVVSPPPLPPHVAAALPLPPCACARPRAVTSLTPFLRCHPLAVPSRRLRCHPLAVLSRRYFPTPLLA